jgi:ADP-heptose:LPS heptosyltransferase
MGLAEMQRFLLIQTASIGDVILITPVIEKLHRLFPDSETDLLIKEGMETLFYDNPHVNRIYIWKKSNHKYQNLFKIIFSIRRRRYNKVINFQRFASSGIITLFSKAEFTCGFNKNPFSLFFTDRKPHFIDPNTGMHEVNRNLSLIESFTDRSSQKPALFPSPADFELVKEYKRGNYITISPSSLWFTKQFPLEKWIDFINEIPWNYPIFLLGSKQDSDLCVLLVNECKFNKVVDLSGKLSLLQSAALMKDASMNFVNDSAPLHLASSVNAPVAAIFCSTITGFGFGPLSDKAYVIETREKLSCRPCGLHGYPACPEHHFKCAKTIRTEQLTSILEDNK